MQTLERDLLPTLRDAGIPIEGYRDAGIPIAGARVLDVGCGTGYFLHRLREYGAGDCLGIDLTEERVAAARQRYPALQFSTGSATELPHPDSSFDLVTQFTCLSSILDADVRLAVAREMSRVARGGWILSFDIRPAAIRRRAVTGRTPTVSLDPAELERLFGPPALLRTATMNFDLAQRRGRLASTIARTPFLRRHLLGVWKVSSAAPGS